jgi:hypothetical protein
MSRGGDRRQNYWSEARRERIAASKEAHQFFRCYQFVHCFGMAFVKTPKDRGEYRQAAVLLGAKPLRVLRERHDSTGKHQQTDDLKQHQ